MSEQPNPFDMLLEQIRAVVRQEIAAAHGNGNNSPTLLTPEDLASKMSVPVSWVFERSRQGEIPTHRIGRYIRFDLAQVLESEKTKKKNSP
jgi:hypothetical protein